jgi:hypothetical protein
MVAFHITADGVFRGPARSIDHIDGKKVKVDPTVGIAKFMT